MSFNEEERSESWPTNCLKFGKRNKIKAKAKAKASYRMNGLQQDLLLQ